MEILIIDVNIIIKKHNLNNILKTIEPLPKTNDVLSVYIAMPKYVYNQLLNSAHKFEFINDNRFTKSIQSFGFITYNKEKNICNIIYTKNTSSVMEQLLYSISIMIPPDALLWVSVKMDDTTSINDLILNKFNSPYVCDINGQKMLCMHRKNVGEKETVTLDRVKKVIEQYKKDGCDMTIGFDYETVKFLKNLCTSGHTMNSDGTISQKEIAGSLILDENIGIIKLDTKSITVGKEEGVSIINDLYNFHSHPKEAYINHSTHIGFPSCQDFLGYLKSIIDVGTIFHIVSSLEGMYIMSINKEWVNRNDELGNKYDFVKKNYNISGKNIDTPYQYTDIINNIQNGIFHVNFVRWNEALKGDRIKVFFQKIKDNCFVNADDIDIANIIHS